MNKIFKKLNTIYRKKALKYGPLMILGLFTFSLLAYHTALAISTNPHTIGPAIPADFKINSEKTNKFIEVEITAYSSTEDQTDDTPFIAASGKHVYDGMVAANFLPFGTKIKIPELFGDKIFTVDDRMNKRYQNRVDIWYSETVDAIKFGIQKAKIEILE
jgi:3D (Asp-Asp-Asp) domain-containing protein